MSGYEFPGIPKWWIVGYTLTHSGGQRSVVAIVSIGYLVAILESHADQEEVLYHPSQYYYPRHINFN